MAAILDYPTYWTRHRPSNVQIQRFKRPNIMSITCWRFSNLNTWRLYWVILRTRHVIGHQKSKYSKQTSKYRVSLMSEVIPLKHHATVLNYPMFLIRQRPSNVQIQRFKRSKVMSIPCLRFSHLNTWRLYWIILCS